MAKDTIYLEVDDEITAVIDKLQDSPQSVVALVLPKRATVFQSIVNMKLLKKTAAKSKKSVVLITSDATVLSIAGAAKMHVAKTLQSKPDIPKAPAEAPDETTAELEDAPLKKAADDKALVPVAPTVDPSEDEAIELDNTGDSAEVVTPGKPNRKLKIPNFNSFRVRFFLIAGLIFLLLVGWVFGGIILPKATITIKTDTSSVETNLAFTASTAAKEVDKENKVLPATAASVEKTDTEKVTATGDKNNGEKATGKVSFIDCRQNLPPSKTVPAGTTISSGGSSFVTTADVVVPASGYHFGVCDNDESSKVGVTAVEPGSKFNLSARTYSVSGFSTMTARDTSGMSGGTDSVIKVVSAADVETAKQRMAGRLKATAVEEMKTQLGSLNLLALAETVDEPAPTLTASPAVGAAAAETTVTAVTKYTMLGISKETLEEILSDDIKTHITNETQQIQDNGLSVGTFAVTEKKSPTEQKLSLKTVATVGPNIDKDAIARNSAGKKRSEIEAALRQLPGVKEVKVTYSPFWVFQTPKAAKKITIVLEQSN